MASRAQHWASPPTPVQWGIRDIVWLLLFSSGAFIALSVLAAVSSEIVGISREALDHVEMRPLRTFRILAVQGVWSVLVVGFMYWCIVIKYGLKFAPALGYVPSPQPIWHFVAAGLLLAPCAGFGLDLLGAEQTPTPLEDLATGPIATAALMPFAVFVAPPFEELLFRGFILLPIERSHGTSTAVLVTGAVFSLLHGWTTDWRWQHLFVLLVVGCIFGTARVRTGSMIPPTVLHIAYNSVVAVASMSASE